MSSPVRTLVVWCPDWPVTAAGYSGTDRVAVLLANRVIACSAGARAEGVVRGLRRRQAESRCPGLAVVASDPSRDARAFEPVAAALDAFTPRVEIVRPGVCALATRGPSRYFGGDERLAETIANAMPFPCRVGIADGPFAAELAARRQRGIVVAPGETPSFLSALPVAALGRPELSALLGRLGITTMGSFAALPAPTVLARFGVDGAAAHRLARGLDERPLAPREPPPDLAVARELDPPADRVDAVAFVAKALADELHGRLAGLALACTRVRIEVDTPRGESLVRIWRHDGVLTAAALAERVRWQLDGWLNASPAGARPGATSGITSGTSGISLLRLVPDEVVADHGRQLGFWGGDQAASERAARALARVQGMLGPEAVTTAVLTGGRGPADQARMVPWGDDRAAVDAGWCSPSGKPELAPPWPGRIPSPAPATVYPVPIAAELEVVDGEPNRLSVAGARWTDVAAWAGPWPVDERWWDPPAHRRRSRWQILTADGEAHLVVGEDGRWFLEATYD